MAKAGRYEVIDQSHGKGGFGEISKQRDKILDRYVAVKRLHHVPDDDLKQRFEHEAKTLAKMSHPNIPAIFDVDFGKDEMLIYFEFIEGENLRQIINLGAISSIEEAVPWFIQVALALEHASGLGIIHRDIKPENIVISHNKTAAYLVDFGIALTSDQVKRITDPGYIVGTLAYMSPEQREGKELDQTSDVYTLGLTLYEVLAGHLPLAGQQYEPLSDANEAIPPGIDDLIKECLIPDRTKRLPSASEFSRKLQDAFRVDIPLSNVLTEGRLHELQAVLQNMLPEDFSSKSKGQKLLVIDKARRLIKTDKPQLLKPTADFLAILVRLMIGESAEQYRIIVDAAYEWGYEKQFAEKWYGDQGVRDALINVAKIAPSAAHSVLSTSILELLKRTGLDGKDRWFYRDLRANLSTLMASQYCEDSADALSELYIQVDDIGSV